MNANFKTTTGHKFSIEVVDHLPDSLAMSDIINDIWDGVNEEELSTRDELLSIVVSTVNRMFKDIAVNAVMLSMDVLRSVCSGVGYAKIYTTKDGNSVILNGGLAQKKVMVGKVDKTPIYENRPDFVQYTDVVRAHNAYNKQLKKEGYKDGYILKGGINARQFDLLTVFAHNLSGKISEKDAKIIEKSGAIFAPFASDSNTKRLEAVQYFYDLFNAHTGHNHKAIGFVVKELKNDKRLATFDSQHYISTVPGEYTLLSVLISHYINTGKKVLEKSRAKKVSDIQPVKAENDTGLTEISEEEIKALRAEEIAEGAEAQAEQEAVFDNK